MSNKLAEMAGSSQIVIHLSYSKWQLWFITSFAQIVCLSFCCPESQACKTVCQYQPWLNNCPGDNILNVTASIQEESLLINVIILTEYHHQTLSKPQLTLILHLRQIFQPVVKMLIGKSIHRGKMEQILLAYGLLKETIAAVTILYKNTKVKVRSPDGDTEYFDIVAGVLQGDTLAPYLFIICLDLHMLYIIMGGCQTVFAHWCMKINI